jgi:hypothetical protein
MESKPGSTVLYFDAFSSREPVPTSLENFTECKYAEGGRPSFGDWLPVRGEDARRQMMMI